MVGGIMKKLWLFTKQTKTEVHYKLTLVNAYKVG